MVCEKLIEVFIWSFPLRYDTVYTANCLIFKSKKRFILLKTYGRPHNPLLIVVFPHLKLIDFLRNINHSS